MDELTVLLGYFASEMVLAIGGIAILVINFTSPNVKGRYLGYLAACTVGVSAFIMPWQGWFVFEAQLVRSTLRPFFSFCLSPDMYATYFKFAIAIGMLITILASLDYVEARLNGVSAELYALLCFATLSMSFMVSAVELITLFLAIELTSIASYALASLDTSNPRSVEAGIKYFLTGAAATAVSLYGMSLIYAFSGTTNLREILNMQTEVGAQFPHLILVSLIMVMASLGFKGALVPFHAWAPDTYEGAPTPVTTFLAAASKVAAVGLIARFMIYGFSESLELWRPVISTISALTMTVGNLFAIPQRNIKRMLAYSSIAHAGYMLIGLAAVSQAEIDFMMGKGLLERTDVAMTGFLLYALGYAFATGGAFTVVLAVSHLLGTEEIPEYDGLSQRMPHLAWALTIFFLSLIGIPPFVGFFTKAFVFAGAIYSGLGWLSIVGVLNSVVSGYYYLNVVRHMFLLPPKAQSVERTAPSTDAALLIALLGTVVVGLLPNPFLQWIRDALNGVILMLR
ncbi:MAG: NADH-quinone oxidoreductase subunit N [Armatimonadota bacterium]|nr:NADH-quinone oxidoreductase subunit N [Armatimonadota bacterium]MCX7776983.1 NADH-quinone oxidoreductase subunit N [Armatimonadota bacterium]MDW8024817.1 NADH-quinone oxidoreductase subunit N [Armatimonadota bacterium]